MGIIKGFCMITITNIVSKEDLNKINCMVRHEMGVIDTLHPSINAGEDGYTIEGVAHLDENTLQREIFKSKCSVLKSLYNEVFSDKKEIRKVLLKSVELSNNQDEDVYDISMNSKNHYFFANNILVHNTDSVYFSVQKYLNEQNDDTKLSKEDVIDLYNVIGENVGDTFPDFMNRTFNTGLENGAIIAAGLEMIGTRGLFLKKKRYGILKYWEDGFRLDTGGKPGKLKAMGMEIKRSDTPKYIQDHLSEVFTDLLCGASEKDLRTKIIDFKKYFKDLDPWIKGSPKTVKNLTNKTKEFRKTGKCSVGHVLASINWNDMREEHNDRESPEITDGSKIIVCKLRPSLQYPGVETIAYPSEAKDSLPKWFKELSFDEKIMEETVLTKKLDNLFGIIDMELGIFEDPNSAASNTDIFDW